MALRAASCTFLFGLLASRADCCVLYVMEPPPFWDQHTAAHTHTHYGCTSAGTSEVLVALSACIWLSQFMRTVAGLPHIPLSVGWLSARPPGVACACYTQPGTFIPRGSTGRNVPCCDVEPVRPDGLLVACTCCNGADGLAECQPSDCLAPVHATHSVVAAGCCVFSTEDFLPGPESDTRAMGTSHTCVLWAFSHTCVCVCVCCCPEASTHARAGLPFGTLCMHPVAFADPTTAGRKNACLGCCCVHLPFCYASLVHGCSLARAHAHAHAHAHGMCACPCAFGHWGAEGCPSLRQLHLPSRASHTCWQLRRLHPLLIVCTCLPVFAGLLGSNMLLRVTADPVRTPNTPLARIGRHACPHMQRRPWLHLCRQGRVILMPRPVATCLTTEGLQQATATATHPSLPLSA